MAGLVGEHGHQATRFLNLLQLRQSPNCCLQKEVNSEDRCQVGLGPSTEFNTHFPQPEDNRTESSEGFVGECGLLPTRHTSTRKH